MLSLMVTGPCLCFSQMMWFCQPHWAMISSPALFAAECKVVGRRITRCLRPWFSGNYPFWNKLLPQVEEFKYLEVYSWVRGKWCRKLTGRLVKPLQRYGCCKDVVVMRELSVKVNVSIYRLLCILILPYGQELYAMTEWMRSWMRAAKIRFHRMLCARVCSPLG